MKKIAHFGAFDHSSFGDLLFPKIAEHFLSDFQLVHVAPTNIPTGWSDAQEIIGVHEAFQQTDWDGVLIGGGDIIQAGGWRSEKWNRSFDPAFCSVTSIWSGASLLASKLDIPLAWNAPGVPTILPELYTTVANLVLSASDYLAVRDQVSADYLSHYTEKAVFVVPDSATLTNHVWPLHSVQKHDHLVFCIGLIDVNTCAEDIQRAITTYREKYANSTKIVALQLMPWQFEFSPDSYQEILGRNKVKVDLISNLSITDTIANIANSKGYIGNSLHGLIVAISYGIPSVLVIPHKSLSHKYEGFLRSVGLDISLHLASSWSQAIDLLSLQNKTIRIPQSASKCLEKHWENIRLVLTSSSSSKSVIWNQFKQLTSEYTDKLALLGVSPTYFHFYSLNDYTQLEQTQSQLEQTQSQLEQTQSQLTLKNESNSNLSFELEFLRNHFQASEEKLRDTDSQINIYRSQLQQSQEYIKWVKTSKFWKLRELIIPLKEKLFSSRSLDPIRFIDIASKYSSPSVPNLGAFSRDYKSSLVKLYKNTLTSFLSSNAKLEFSTYGKPLVSVILVLFNRCELTFQCIQSLLNSAFIPLEVIIIDNASSDETSLLLQSLKGVNVVSNSSNLHFLEAANQGAAIAKGDYILFLNNDAQLLPNSLQEAIKTIQICDNIGAVGGKILLLDGSLQEAGSIIWKDGSCLGYGRGDDPFAPEYMFQRDVDYCSGAFLLTRRDLFLRYGCFDTDYKPAYYEETDFCLKLWENGLRVVYNPNIVILHFEFASSSSSDSPIHLQQVNQKKFISKHSNKLLSHHCSGEKNITVARHAASINQKRILFIDDRVPHAFLGSGYPRARDILYSLTELNSFVTFYPLNTPEEDWQSVYQDIPLTTEVMIGYGQSKLSDFLKSRFGFYDYILVSRPHNMSLFQQCIEKDQIVLGASKIIYDAEAVYALREIKRYELLGKPLSEFQKKSLIQKELQLAKGCDHIVAVSDFEKKQFEDFGHQSTSILSCTVDLNPTPLGFDQRKDILFVGAIHDDKSPNADSVEWFIKEILPLIHKNLQDKNIKFTVAGFNKSQRIFDLASDQVNILGKVEDLSVLYNSHKIFVVPNRFSAGIPLKIYHAVAHGLPVVTTSLIATQVGWQDEKQLLIADDPDIFASQCVRLYNKLELWQKLRNESLKKIDQECSKQVFTNQIRKLLFT
jgi:O-antigen biosynthesis protein